MPARAMARRLQLLLLPVLLLAGLLAWLTLSSNPTGAATIVATPIASKLKFPAAFTIGPDGRIFYGELRTGAIRIFDPRDSSNEPFFAFSDIAVTKGGGGLTGLALHPDFPREPFVYASVTRRVSGENRIQVVRIRDKLLEAIGFVRQTTGTEADLELIYDAGVVSETGRVGGRLLFGPDRMLYLSVGDKNRLASAQNVRTPEGKVLRIGPAGGIAPRNPFPRSPTFAYGLGSSFGFAFDPETRRMWLTDQGTRCNDELNLVQRGQNFGWGPSRTCRTPPAAPRNTNRTGRDPVLPKRFITPTIAPTGAVFCVRCGLGPESERRLFWGAWQNGIIRRVTLNRSRTGISSEQMAYKHPRWVMSMERAPDGAIYFSDPKAIYKLELR